jgi:hypothetical protein
VQLAQDFEQPLFGRMRQRDDDAVDLELARQFDEFGGRPVRQLAQPDANHAPPDPLIEHADNLD